MDNILGKLAQLYRNGSLLIKLIYLNVAVFLILRLSIVFLMLFNIDGRIILNYFELPSDLYLLLVRPWTLVTYMFLHYDIWHILFNMIWFYWFGQIFLLFFSEKQMGGLYLLGGWAGAILFLLSYNIFPYFDSVDGFLLGASAAILAIVVATAVYAPDYKINLLFFGAISLKYIAIITIVIDLLSITSSNAGGHIAHLGGALMGWWFVSSWRKGHDMTRFINLIVDRLVTMFKPGPRKKMKIKKMNISQNPRRESDMDYNARKHREMEEIDHILDKIKQSGYSALSDAEKKKLFDASKK